MMTKRSSSPGGLGQSKAKRQRSDQCEDDARGQNDTNKVCQNCSKIDFKEIFGATEVNSEVGKYVMSIGSPTKTSSVLYAGSLL
jgi:hypothetical protein